MNFQAINALLVKNGGYDIFNAHFCIFLSELAYKEPEYIKEILNIDAGNVQFHFFDDQESTQGFILLFENNVFVAFRGTEYSNLRGFINDWKTDFEIAQVEFQPGHPNTGNVHEGFNKGLSNVWETIQAQLPNSSNYHFWFTGHSLGGALATLATAKFAGLSDTHHERVAGCYTFGAPMCGNSQFAENYERLMISKKTFRFQNNNDIIPSAPFLGSHVSSYFRTPGILINAAANTLLLAVPSPLYQHVGQLYYINRHGEIKTDSSYISRRVDYTLGALTGGAILDKLLDHRHKTYFIPIRDQNQRADLIPDIPDPLTPRTTCVIA